MCDTNIRKASEKPAVVYKVVQQLSPTRFASTVFGSPLTLGRWKTAPKTPKPKENVGGGLLKFLAGLKTWTWKGFKLVPPDYGSSWNPQHSGHYNSFARLGDAKWADLQSNLATEADAKKAVESGYHGDAPKLPKVVVECEVDGEILTGYYGTSQTYLSERLKIVRVVETL
jgi:hypothetical protein